MIVETYQGSDNINFLWELHEKVLPEPSKTKCQMMEIA